ncbi:MAG: toxic anion resistance protein [Lachnospiraceae bacterium]|nr:toxic anion resistance protein [Lachnospiraceae bacterium]
MSDEFKSFETVPTLTFDTDAAPAAAPAETVDKDSLAASFQEDAKAAPTPVLTLEPAAEEVPQAPKPQEAVLDDSALSEEEKKMVEDFSQKIDIHNSGAILQYGVGTQKKMADFSEKALENVKSKDIGEVGDMISGLVTELQDFDVEEEKGFLGFFKKQANKVTALKAKYEKAEVNVEKICDSLEGHQVQLMKDIAVLDKMYDLNLNYFKELSMYILAGKKQLQRVRDGELQELVAKAQASGQPEDAQAAKDLDALCNRFEKKVHDLELTRMIAMQTAPQIRMVQNSNTMMVEKIQSTLVNTIPLWKNQMVIALGVEHSTEAAMAQRQVTDLTNELLKKNAEKLKTATVETAKESERGIVDMETLRITNASLISTLDEVVKIQTEGRKNRQNAELEMQKMENELKQKLLSMSK